MGMYDLSTKDITKEIIKMNIKRYDNLHFNHFNKYISENGLIAFQQALYCCAKRAYGLSSDSSSEKITRCEIQT